MSISATMTLTSVLPKQTIDFSVPNPVATKQLSMPLYNGANFRADFKTWSLVQSGGFMCFNLVLPEPIPVDLTLDCCAALVGGIANCPVTIKVNSQVLVPSYSDHNANWHNDAFVIPQAMLNAGNNEILIQLDPTATTQFFIRGVTVDQAVLATQTLDLSVPNPLPTPQVSMQSRSGAGYRADFKTWSLLVNGSYISFNLTLGTPIPVDMALNLCAALVQGRANCPISITVNGKPLVQGYRDTNANFHPVPFQINQNMLRTGSNNITVSLDTDASTQMFINALTLSGE